MPLVQEPTDSLALENIRGVLARLEETILFGLIERAQFCRNEIIYRPGGLGPQLGGESLMAYLLHECERAHAKVRRYTSPDEHPFFHDLPAPALPPAAYKNPLRSNAININDRIQRAYEEEIIPFLCAPGDDGQWGSSAVNDVSLLQALSKRIHYGKFVAESKYRENPSRFDPMIRARDAAGLLASVTDVAVEAAVLDRVARKTETFAKELHALPGSRTASPEQARTIYERWIIPLNKDVQVLYLLGRG